MVFMRNKKKILQRLPFLGLQQDWSVDNFTLPKIDYTSLRVKLLRITFF